MNNSPFISLNCRFRADSGWRGVQQRRGTARGRGWAFGWAMWALSICLAIGWLAAVEGQGVASSSCNIMDMYAHLLSISSDEECRSGRNEGQGDPPGEQPGAQWFPGATDYCNAMCGAVFEPFYDQCGELLTSMDMGGMEEMGLFCECLRCSRLTPSTAALLQLC